MVLKCERCGSNRVANLTSKCSDMCHISINNYDEAGYVPNDMGIGGGDYIEFSWCLECGSIQGKWPINECAAEEFDPRKCSCGWDKFDSLGECENCGEHKKLWCPKCESETVFNRLAYNSLMAKGKYCGCVVSIESLENFQKEIGNG